MNYTFTNSWSMGNQKSVAIFGGAFNPPHIGHLNVAKTILNKIDCISEINFVPSIDESYKDLAPIQHRCNMLEIMLENETNMSVLITDVVKTFDFAEQFSQTGKDFYFVIGQDNANKIYNWKNHNKLTEKYKFIVVERECSKPDLDWYKVEPHIFLNFDTKASSSSFRKLYKSNSFAKCIDKYIIHPNVLQYIEKNSVYPKESQV